MSNLESNAFQRIVLRKNPLILFSVHIRKINATGNTVLLLSDVQRLHPSVTTLFLDGYPLPTLFNEDTGKEVEPVQYKADYTRVYEAYDPENTFTSFTDKLLSQVEALTTQLISITNHLQRIRSDDSIEDLQQKPENESVESPDTSLPTVFVNDRPPAFVPSSSAISLSVPPPNYELPPVYDSIVIQNTKIFRTSLFEFEDNILDNYKHPRFIASRNINWLQRTNTANILSDFQSVLMLLETGLERTCFLQSWVSDREGWRERVRNVKNIVELMGCLKELEMNLLRDVLKSNWEGLREGCLNNVNK